MFARGPAWYRRHHSERPSLITVMALSTFVLSSTLTMISARAEELRVPEILTPPDVEHPLNVRDLWQLERISDPQPSPNGRWIAYEIRKYDVAGNTWHSNLALVSADGKRHRRLTTADVRDRQPRWSEDSKHVRFRSNRSGSYQVWSIPVDGGEPEQLTRLPVAVESFRWSPDGRRLAFVASVYPDCADLACTAERDDATAEDPIQARLFDSTLFRHWDSWDDGKRPHIFVMTLDGEPRDFLQGTDMQAPPPPWGGVESYDWSPAGDGIVFEARLRSDDAAWSTDHDLYWADLESTELVCITEANLATDAHPVFAPDGDRIAYLAMKRPGYESDRFRIVTFDLKSGKRQVLTENWDRSPAEMLWSNNAKTLYVTNRDHGRRRLSRVDAANGQVRPILMPGSVRSLSVSRYRGTERLVFLMETLSQPRDIYSCRPDGSDLRRLTRVNDERLAKAQMSTPERLTYPGANGDTIEAWFLPPVGWRQGMSYPLVLLIHGGPQGSWEDAFSYRWNQQLYAAAGYAVLAPDFHGSTGYGQAFTDAIRKDWGGQPYEDLMKGVDFILAEKAWIDAERMAAAGASYGGYMINWIAGQTQRFKCLVNHAGLFDLESFYGATEEQWFPEWEFGGEPWKNREVYRTWSPSNYVDSWKTPMLVVHGGQDYRVPEAQGFATYTTLKRLGIPAKFLHFPDENHWILKPQNAILWQDTILQWLEAHLSASRKSGESE